MRFLTETEKILNEKLEQASPQQFEFLQKQIETNTETQKMLTTPMKDIPQYEHIFRIELTNPLLKTATLYDALLMLSVYPKTKLEFSKAGNIFTGFIVYRTEGNSIIALKTASFKNNSNNRSVNPILAGDLLTFLNREVRKRSKIEWVAYLSNENAIMQYNRALDKLKYIWTSVPLDNGKVRYTVTGKK